ncbi:hypothetical protein PAXINDRAFT_9376 [Paxillus involutus ATCC 200175]|nr:hypothetical protein PAXINDRAFT_9376 [Paxillus involutus ATCC 200175]
MLPTTPLAIQCAIIVVTFVISIPTYTFCSPLWDGTCSFTDKIRCSAVAFPSTIVTLVMGFIFNAKHLKPYQEGHRIVYIVYMFCATAGVYALSCTVGNWAHPITMVVRGIVLMAFHMLHAAVVNIAATRDPGPETPATDDVRILQTILAWVTGATTTVTEPPCKFSQYPSTKCPSDNVYQLLSSKTDQGSNDTLV